MPTTFETTARCDILFAIILSNPFLLRDSCAIGLHHFTNEGAQLEVGRMMHGLYARAEKMLDMSSVEIPSAPGQ